MTTFNFELPKKEVDGDESILKWNRFLLKILARRMRQKGMTRKKLAEELGVDKSTISRMLRESNNITARTFGEICGALDFSFNISEVDLLEISSNHNAETETFSRTVDLAEGATGTSTSPNSYIWMQENASNAQAR